MNVLVLAPHPDDETLAALRTRFESLTAREKQVIGLVAAGLSNKQIAQQLSISLRTVKYHTTSIYTKLDVESRVQAVTRARDLGLLS